MIFLPNSIRVRVIAMMLAIFMIAVVVSVIGVQRKSLHELDEMLDANLAQSSRLIFALISYELDSGREQGMEQIVRRFIQQQQIDHFHRTTGKYEDSENDENNEAWEYECHIYLQLNGPDKKTLFSTRQTNLLPAGETRTGYFNHDSGENNWRMYGLTDSTGRYQLYMGQSDFYREDMNKEASDNIVIPLIIFIPLLTLAIGWGVNRALKPVSALSEAITVRDPDNLTAIKSNGGLEELKPVVGALNGLLSRLSSALENERRFTADASHELRSPIAAMRAQLGVIEGARSDEEKQRAIDNLDLASTRMTRLVDELLALARLDGGTQTLEKKPFDLRKTLMNHLGEQAVGALGKGVELELAAEKPVIVNSVEYLVDLIVSNLISNAIKYTPHDGLVLVSLKQEGHSIICDVTDTGPGIQDSERERVFERFFQSKKIAGEGVGLGLSIARRAADLAGVKIELANAEAGGLNAKLIFQYNQDLV